MDGQHDSSSASHTVRIIVSLSSVGDDVEAGVILGIAVGGGSDGNDISVDVLMDVCVGFRVGSICTSEILQPLTRRIRIMESIILRMASNLPVPPIPTHPFLNELASDIPTIIPVFTYRCQICH
jgi:hypothetical protein